MRGLKSPQSQLVFLEGVFAGTLCWVYERVDPSLQNKIKSEAKKGKTAQQILLDLTFEESNADLIRKALVYNFTSLSKALEGRK